MRQVGNRLIQGQLTAALAGSLRHRAFKTANFEPENALTRFKAANIIPYLKLISKKVLTDLNTGYILTLFNE
jgi:hypothetical protein